MRAQPMTYVQRPPTTDAMPVEPDTLEVIRDWVRATVPGVEANVIGPADPSSTLPPALYLSGGEWTHRAEVGEWVLVTPDGSLGVLTDESFRRQWERPERPGRGQ